MILFADTWGLQKSNLVEFCSILQNIFAREPPVVARRQPPTAQLQPVQQREPPPIPPLPPEIGRRRPDQARGPLAQTSGQRGPPPPPPKEVDGLDQNQHVNSSPPLPPHPSRMGTQSTSQQSGHTNGYLRDSQSIARPHPLESSPSWRYNHGEPYSNYNASKIDQPQVRPNQLSPQPDGRRQNGHLPSMVYAEPPQGPLGPQLYANSQTFNSPPPQPGRTQFPDHTARPHQSPRQPRQQQPYAKQPPQMPKAKPQEDLLTSPFDNPLPAQPVNIAPPPIPPNPQKDALLSALSQSLTQQVQSTYDSNLSALPPLRAQQAAITSTSNAINAEMSQLNDLQALLSSNEAILHKAMQDADKVLEDAKRRKVPDVDDVLVAPSVVAGQLYQLVAEERAIENSRGVLNKALDRGRIGPGLWAKVCFYKSEIGQEMLMNMTAISKLSPGGVPQEGANHENLTRHGFNGW